MEAFKFSTPEVGRLFQQIEPWSHPEYPFLDAFYSPASNAPVTDLTPAVAQWIREKRYGAIAELWKFITSPGPVSRMLLDKALSARVPSVIRLAPEAEAELRAIHSLVLRTTLSHGDFYVPMAIRLVASTLACYPILFEQADVPVLLRSVEKSVESGLLWKAYGAKESARRSIEIASASVEAAQPAAERLRTVAPMVRLVIHDYLFRGWGYGTLRYDLYYDERMYGCGRGPNQIEIEKLGFFGPPNDDVTVPAAVTKKVLKTELEAAGFQFKNSDTRKAMIEIARNIPGLISSLILRVYPEQRSLNAQWGPTVKEWAAGIQSLEPIASYIVRSMAFQSLNVRRAGSTRNANHDNWD